MVAVNVAGAGRFGFAPLRWETTQQKVLAALAAEHARVPEVLGLEGRRLRRLATPELPSDMFTALIDQLLGRQPAQTPAFEAEDRKSTRPNSSHRRSS